MDKREKITLVVNIIFLQILAAVNCFMRNENVLGVIWCILSAGNVIDAIVTACTKEK